MTHHAYAPPAAARGGLDQDRVADALCFQPGLLPIRAGFVCALDDRQALFASETSRRDLVAQQADGAGRRTDEGDAGISAGFGEV